MSESSETNQASTQSETGNNELISDNRSLRRYAQLAAFGVLSLLALIAIIRFYMASARAISIWIAPDFEPLFQAGFNLVILIFAVAGVSVLGQRLTV
ncbi:MAG: hypothetical protein J07HQX50_01047 [Haloquadratum sp. J07HQX50]|nr:MAG: hypothetical protein J07HQX50_01047 [Haloquadratum sp. J07HQX50]